MRCILTLTRDAYSWYYIRKPTRIHKNDTLTSNGRTHTDAREHGAHGARSHTLY